MQKALKILFSIWILVHLAAMVVLPNAGSFVGRHMPLFISEYGNSVGLNNSWNFFSPDPAHTMYLRFKVRFEDANGNETRETVEGFLPPEKEKVVIDSSRRRMLYAMRFLMLDRKRMEALFEPWLCRQYPGASEVSVFYVQERLPNLDLALVNLDTPVNELKEEFQNFSNTHKCGSGNDEVEL